MLKRQYIFFFKFFFVIEILFKFHELLIMEENNLYSKTIDAVEIFSNSNLLLETNTQIQFNTPQLLINFIPFDEFIKKIVFQTDITQLTRDTANIQDNGNPAARDLTEAYNNNATLTVDNVYCSNISANNSKVDIDGTSKYHCVTLSTSNNLILRNTSDYNNIEYNSNNNLSSLSNYIYHILNNTTFTQDDLTANTNNLANARDISSFGTYFTNKIITSNVYTSSVGDSTGKESILGISSDSAVNLHIYQDAGASLDADGLRNIASNIILSDDSTSSNLKDYIYSFLDETVVYQLEMSGTGNPGVNITLDNITFTRTITGTPPFITDPFTYNIVFKIYEYDASETPTQPGPNVVNPSSPNTEPTLDDKVANVAISSTETKTFTGLTAGTFYSIYADITNNVTNTTVNNIGVAYEIPTIMPQTIQSIILTRDNRIEIIFTRHPMTQSIDGLITTFSIKEDSTSFIDTNLRQDFETFLPTEYTYVFNASSLTRDFFNTTSYTFTLRNNLRMEKEGSINIALDTITTTIDGATTSQTNLIRAPTKPGRPSMVYIDGPNNGRLSWSASGTQVTNSVQLTYINYEIHFNSAPLTTTTHTSISTNINLGTYYVKAKNYYEQFTDSDHYTIYQPIITITQELTFSSPLEFYVNFAYSDTNGFSFASSGISGTIDQGGSFIVTDYINNKVKFSLPDSLNGSLTISYTISITDDLNITNSIDGSIIKNIVFFPPSDIIVNVDSTKIARIQLPTPTSSVYTYRWSSVVLTESETSVNGFVNSGIYTSNETTQSVTLIPVSALYKCTIEETNEEGFVKEYIKQVNITRPSVISNVSEEDKSHLWIQIHWRGARWGDYGLGSHGTPLDTITTLRIYYFKGSSIPATLEDYTGSIDFTTGDDGSRHTLTSGFGTKKIENLDISSDYVITLAKVYNFYGVVISTPLTSSTSTSTKPQSATIFNISNSSASSSVLEVVWNSFGNHGVPIAADALFTAYIVYSSTYSDINNIVNEPDPKSTFADYQSYFSGVSSQEISSSEQADNKSMTLTGLNRNTRYYVKIIKLYTAFDYGMYVSDFVSQQTTNILDSVIILTDTNHATYGEAESSEYSSGNTYILKWVYPTDETLDISSTRNNPLSTFSLYRDNVLIDSNMTYRSTIINEAYRVIYYEFNTPLDSRDSVEYKIKRTNTYLVGLVFDTVDSNSIKINHKDEEPTAPYFYNNDPHSITEHLINNNVRNSTIYTYNWWDTMKGNYTYKWNTGNNSSISDRYNISYKIEVDSGSGYVLLNPHSITVVGSVVTVTIHHDIPSDAGQSITYDIKIIKQMSIKHGHVRRGLSSSYSLDYTDSNYQITITRYDEGPTVSDYANVTTNSTSESIEFTWYKNNTSETTFKVFMIDLYNVYDQGYVRNIDILIQNLVIEYDLSGANAGADAGDGGYKKTINGLRSGWDYLFMISRSSKWFIRRTLGTQTTVRNGITVSNPTLLPNGFADIDYIRYINSESSYSIQQQYNLEYSLGYDYRVTKAPSVHTFNGILANNYEEKKRMISCMGKLPVYENESFHREMLFNNDSTDPTNVYSHGFLDDYSFPRYFFTGSETHQYQPFTLNGWPNTSISSQEIAGIIDAFGSEDSTIIIPGVGVQYPD